MKLVDVHAHMDFPEFKKDLNQVISRAETAGVKAIISNGTDIASNRRVLELSSKYPLIKPALGFYPTDIIKVSEEEFLKELAFIKNQKPIALGEIGLDAKFGEFNPEEKYSLQKERFMEIISLAEKIKRPVLLHTRKAELDVIEIMESSKLKEVDFHCFSGKKSLVKRIIDNGWKMSIPVNSFKVQQFQQNIEMLPLNQILTETDSPFLSGTDERNEPANVIKTIKLIAKMKKMEDEEVANQIFMNYQRFVA